MGADADPGNSELEDLVGLMHFRLDVIWRPDADPEKWKAWMFPGEMMHSRLGEVRGNDADPWRG